MKALIHEKEPEQTSAQQPAAGTTENPTSGCVRSEEDGVNEAHEPTHPFVNVIVLQLNKAGADCSDVALLIGERHASGSLWIFELWVGVDASVANTSVQPVHDHSQLHWRERSNENVSEADH